MKRQKAVISIAVTVMVMLLLFSFDAFGQEGAAPVTENDISISTESEGAAPAPVTENDTSIYTESIAALTKLFVLAVLIESALALIFNWRVFLEFFNKRAIKTIVMFVVSLTVVRTFDIDIVADLMKIYDPNSNPSNMMSTTLTALILAGGSSGVNNLFIALGFRSRRREQTPQPPKNEAWIAILIHRDSAATGEVLVQISEETSGGTAEHDSIAGSINARKKLRDLFFPNRNRFPSSGGYKVEAGKVYQISVSGKDESGNPQTALGETYSFAPRAIVDLDVTI